MANKKPAKAKKAKPAKPAKGIKVAGGKKKPGGGDPGIDPPQDEN